MRLKKSLVSLAITLTDIYYKVNLMVILYRSANYAHIPINIVKKYDWTVKYTLLTASFRGYTGIYSKYNVHPLNNFQDIRQNQRIVKYWSP